MSERNPFGGRIIHLTPAEVSVGLENGTMLLVDVREPDEIRMERIPGAVDLPLSRFGFEPLPDPSGRQLVFYCHSGVRSMQAAAIVQRAGLPFDAHMAGGIVAWTAAGYAIERG